MILFETAKASGLGGIFGKAFNYIFEWVYNITPGWSLGIAIILFAIIVKLLLLPLAIKQQKSLSKTQEMQPELKALQDKYKDKKDPESQQQMATEMQNLYSKYNTNPFAGCLLSLIQIPIIITLFDVLKKAFVYIERLSTVYTSLANDIMSVPNSTELLTNLGKAKRLAAIDYSVIDNVKSLFTTLNSADWSALLGDITSHVDVNAMQTLISQKEQIESFCGINLINQPSLMSISVILPILTVLLTYVSIKMTTNAQKSVEMDEKTESMMKNMSSMNNFLIILVFISSMSFPAGLSLYWSLNNLWQIGQQKLIKKYIK